MGDIGTHAYNLLRFVTGLTVNKIAATTESFHPTRAIDDYGLIQMRMDNGALGLITYSQMSHGRLNDFTLEIDGTKGSLQWRQEDPNQLVLRRQEASTEIMHRHPAGDYMHELAKASTRIPGGHPEGFYEAFANIYRATFDDMAKTSPLDSIQELTHSTRMSTTVSRVYGSSNEYRPVPIQTIVGLTFKNGFVDKPLPMPCLPA